MTVFVVVAGIIILVVMLNSNFATRFTMGSSARAFMEKYPEIPFKEALRLSLFKTRPGWNDVARLAAFDGLAVGIADENSLVRIARKIENSQEARETGQLKMLNILDNLAQQRLQKTNGDYKAALIMGLGEANPRWKDPTVVEAFQLATEHTEEIEEILALTYGIDFSSWESRITSES